MIRYIEKGPRMHRFICDAGYSIEQLNGEWVTSDDRAVQAIIDRYDPLPEEKTEAKDFIDKTDSMIKHLKPSFIDDLAEPCNEDVE